MFWIAPIHTPNMPVRRSPKYFQVSESGPSGLAAGTRGTAAVVRFEFVVELDVMVSSLGENPRRSVTISVTTRVVHDLRARRLAPLRSGDGSGTRP